MSLWPAPMSRRSACTSELGIVNTETTASISIPVKIVCKESAVAKTVLKEIENLAGMVSPVPELPPVSFSIKKKEQDQLTHFALK